MKDYNEIDSHGTKRWRNNNGQYHREDGPAIEWADGAKEWWVNDRRHRLDGPAYVGPGGSSAWWVNDTFIEKDNFPKAVVMFLLNVNEETAKLILSDNLFQNESF